MTDLSTWLQRVTRTVEGDGAHAAMVRLVTSHDGQTWNTWRAPWGDASDLEVDVSAYLRSLEQQWPSRNVQVCFIAETPSGEVISQLPHTVTGRAKAGTLDSSNAATAVAFDSLANTIEKLQRLTNTQLDAARRTAEVNATTIEQQSYLIRLLKDRESVGYESSGVDKLVEQHGNELVGMLGMLAQHVLEKMKEPK